ncbi:uncharacterized protein LOC126728140 [Quercus robur]|uniref:uncharacterized protein LOC126728140 n=1 Tax=Quercus robur TaxID=38942 RepID=UPI002163CFDD|nr:uncharacterized protein LOC126728140 [Quercus robur]
MGKVVTHLQFKNKWDHLRKQWKAWKECFDRETGLGYDSVTGKLEASDEWWTQKIESMGIMFDGTVATGKNVFCTSVEIPKESIEGSGDFADNKEFVDPQCQPSTNVDLMEVEGPSSSRAGPAVNKGKGLNISDVIVESRSVSTRTPFASIAAVEVQAVLDMVLSLLGVIGILTETYLALLMNWELSHSQIG